jgi:bifunctional non-homologous end joining protein LigD
MLASLVDAPLVHPELVYEPKYDGIRAIAEITPGPLKRGSVRLWSRLGNEKTSQFPEVASALETWARRRKLRDAVVLDGEIVALDANGTPAGFQQLQGRIHLTGGQGQLPVAFIAFDVLRQGRADFRGRPLLERRAILEQLFAGAGDASPGRALLRLSEVARGDGRALYERALAHGWEGLIAKQAGSIYQSGKRTPDWRKLKIVQEQEFVVGGWTEPRHARSYFGALLLGVYDRPASLVYVGHTGTGFNERELSRLMALLRPLEIADCPFQPRPRTNERPHWVRPKLVAQIKFTEWTADGKLRHPVYLGLRDDKKAEDVVKEPKARLHKASSVRLGEQGPPMPNAREVRPKPDTTSVRSLVERLTELEQARKDGVLELPGGHTLKVTNLHKVFWPESKLTKGDLLRYYVEVSPFILPAVADRPLVMKRYPDGVAAKPFYQHRADDVPAGVRVERVEAADKRQQIVGGDLLTLLYTTQLAAISQDPWFSRVQTVGFADYAALDLDPPDDAKFERVLDVARLIRDELDTVGAAGVAKTSGANGLHIYIPLPPRTPYEAGLLFCQIIATVVAQKHPRIATIERSVRARGSRVYIDCLQNILGKTLATAYSARASAFAGVSTPLTWDEVDEGVRREDFTIQTVAARLRRVGDLWSQLRTSKGVDLARIERYSRTGKSGVTARPRKGAAGRENAGRARKK